jgi:hypothetical protein
MNQATYQNFRRSAVPPQVAQQLQTITIPAPTRGLVLNENESFMQPGGALVLDNWKPTMKGLAVRGGSKNWTQLPETTPVVSMFSYISGNTHKMFAGNATKLYDVTSDPPVLVKSGQTSGNYAASQLANQGGDWMIVVNDTGDYPLRYNGTTWETLNPAYTPGAGFPPRISAPVTTPPATVQDGHNLTYVWKYRNRFFFIEGGSMNAWYLPLNATGGVLSMIPLSGAATKGGKLLCGFTLSINAGDGIDDKNCFLTDQGEILIFTGSDPSTAANWRQEGRYATSQPLGMNAHLAIGGDVLIATVDGIIPISASINKDTSQLELAAITRAIKPMWRDEVNLKRALPWTMMKWDEYGGMFVTYPGGTPGAYTMGAVNIATGAWARFTGWDAMCFGRIREDAFFGTQDGRIVQCDRTGTDNGASYVCTMVGGWEMFSSQSATVVWRQARAAFTARYPFAPQLSATTDYQITIPAPPFPIPDPGTLDVWDQGVWGPTPGWTPPWSPANPLPVQGAPSAPDKAAYLQWDQPAPAVSPVRNTGWVSIGFTGFSHAPIVQIAISQAAPPDIELISIAATYDMAGVNV